ncbi:MAG: cytochrome c oxidase subunit 3 [Myxococcota bacterium]|nr:cytochrome c oxidase subunit 3 [Myxococcota bacterium]
MSNAISNEHELPSAMHATELPHGRMGMWWFLSSEVIIFGGLVVTYILCRMHHSEWALEAANTINMAGALNTMVLLTSSFVVVKAHEAAHKGDNAKAARLLFVTVGFGLIFLCVKAYEYHHEIVQGFVPTANLFWGFYYLMTGLHGLHVVGGMVAMVIVALGVQRGNDPVGVEYVGMYWHIVDIVWIFLFPLLYLAS